MRRVALIVLLFFASVVNAAQVEVKSVRSWTDQKGTRVVFDLTAPVKHSVFTLQRPARVVVDLKKTRMSSRYRPPKRGDLLSGMRHAPRRGKDLRIVLDLNSTAIPKSFLLGPDGKSGHRLVVDLQPKAVAVKGKSAKKAKPVKKSSTVKGRDVVVAIDAGHGGRDHGATGATGLKEKDAVLAIAKRLARLIDKEPGMKAVLTRKGDYKLKLRTRINKARKAKADLFVSIHADAFRDPRARGSSVYVLSSRGASSEAARWLAQSENSVDLVGGVSLEDKDDDLAKVLLDLSQAATIESSGQAAASVLRQLRRVGRVHRKHVERAAFVVLKSPDIPSMLIETAFISNPDEERKLRDKNHQIRLANAMLKGIKSHFKSRPPAGTWFAQKRKRMASASNTAGG